MTDDLGAHLAALEAAQLVADAFGRGDSAGAVAAAAGVLDDAAAIERMREMSVEVLVDLAYHGGIARLQTGDPDGAAAWLGIVAHLPEASPAVRRGLAQIEVTRGRFDAARSLLDTGPGADPMDLAIAAAIAGCERDRFAVLRLSLAVLEALDGDDDRHPWDQAGMSVLTGFALVEVGESENALMAARTVALLIEDAPAEVRLVAQRWVLEAGGRRLGGDLDGATQALDSAWGLLHAGSCDRGMAERELARCRAAAGDVPGAIEAYDAAIATFRAAGESWLATDTEREARPPAV